MAAILAPIHDVRDFFSLIEVFLEGSVQKGECT